MNSGLQEVHGSQPESIDLYHLLKDVWAAVDPDPASETDAKPTTINDLQDVYGSQPESIDLYQLLKNVWEEAKLDVASETGAEPTTINEATHSGESSSSVGNKKNRAHHRSADRSDPRSFADETRKLGKLVTTALLPENTVRYSDYSLDEELENVRNGRPTRVSTEYKLEPKGPRCGRDSNDKLLWVVIPDALGPRGISAVTRQLTTFGEAAKLKRGDTADAGGRGSASAYKDTPGGLTGVFSLVNAWTGIGHDKDPLGMSADRLKNVMTFGKCQQLVNELKLTSHRMNTILKLIDEPAYNASKELRFRLDKLPYHRTLTSIDDLLWEGRSIIFNRTTPNHRDRRDMETAWTPLLTAGEYEGGDLRLEGLGTDLPYGPGSIIFIRGGIMKHEVLGWEGRQRIAVAHFTHKYVWERLGVTYPS